MNRVMLAAAAALSLGGCVVYDYDDTTPTGPGGTVVIVEDGNYDPYVVSAAAYVYFDQYYFDDIWTFEATVDDPNGVGDIIGVWADVYDEYAGGVLVESFELYPTNDPYFWFSDWFGSTTWLDPFWGGYTVDFVVYDSFECFGYTTVWAETY